MGSLQPDDCAPYDDPRDWLVRLHLRNAESLPGYPRYHIAQIYWDAATGLLCESVSQGVGTFDTNICERVAFIEVMDPETQTYGSISIPAITQDRLDALAHHGDLYCLSRPGREGG